MSHVRGGSDTSTATVIRSATEINQLCNGASISVHQTVVQTKRRRALVSRFPMSQGNGFWDRVNEAMAKQNPDELRESCLVTTAMHGTMGNTLIVLQAFVSA